jgi:hypothetical protein
MQKMQNPVKFEVGEAGRGAEEQRRQVKKRLANCATILVEALGSESTTRTTTRMRNEAVKG